MRLALLQGVAVAAALSGPAPAHGQCGPSGCYTPPRSTPSPSEGEPASRLPSHPSIARIVHEDNQGASLGSGTLVAITAGRGYVVTCAHLFDGPGRTTVRLAGRASPARLIAIDRRHDLALLETQQPHGRPAATAELASTGELRACGYGPNGVLRCVRGSITGYAKAAGAEAPSVRMRSAVRSGDSGGPVFNAAGQLVAVVWGQRSGETYAMGGAPLRRVLERLPKRSLRPIEREQPKEPLPAGALRALEERLRVLERRPWRAPTTDVVGSEPPAGGSLPRGADSPAERSEEPGTSVIGSVSQALEPLIPALAIGGPLGIALWAGRLWLRRRLANKPQRVGDTRPVAVDSPPPPQRVTPETHYVSYERDSFARAHQWACEQLARKFPGSVELLTSLDSLIKQQLNGED